MRDKAFNFDKNLKYDGYQHRLASMVYKFFDKKTCGRLTRSDTLAMQNKFAGSGIKNENMSDQQLAEELHNPVIRKFEKRKLHLSFLDNIWGC